MEILGLALIILGGFVVLCACKQASDYDEMSQKLFDETQDK